MHKKTRELSTMKAIILAAGVGSRIRPMTNNRPKCLLQIGRTSILERMVSNIQFFGINEVIFILGYRAEQIIEAIKTKFPELNVRFVINIHYATTNTGFSLMLAKDFIKDSDFIKFDADVVFEKIILKKLIESQHLNCLCIDKDIHLENEEIKVILDQKDRVVKISKEEDTKLSAGESIGIEKIGRSASKILFFELEKMMKNKKNHQNYYESSYTELIKRNIPFHALNISGLKWVEIDTKNDFITAEKMFHDEEALP